MLFQHVHRFLILNKNATLKDLMKEFKVSLNELVAFLSKVEKDSQKKLIKRQFRIYSKNSHLGIVPSNLLIKYSYHFNENFDCSCATKKKMITKGEQYLLLFLKHNLTVKQIKDIYHLNSSGTVYNAIRDIWDISQICKEIKNGKKKRFIKK